jgi:hypothetical protein
MNHRTPAASSTAPQELHWILRVTPEQQRDRIQRLGTIVGAFCQMLWMLSAFTGLFLGPILFAVWRPTAPISQPVLWLQRISGPEWSIVSYTLAMLMFIGLVRVGCSFFDYVTRTKSHQTDHRPNWGEQNAGGNGS